MSKKENDQEKDVEVQDQVLESSQEITEDEEILESGTHDSNPDASPDPELELKSDSEGGEISGEGDDEIVEDEIVTKEENPIRFIAKDIVAIDIVHSQNELLPAKLRVELIDPNGTEVTILSDGKYYRVPKSILL